MKPSRRIPELQLPYPDLPDIHGEVFAIFAHADDELGVAGKLTTLGTPVHWIVVSDSARGFIAPFFLRGRSKAQCRWDEASAAARALGLAAPSGLRLPDGGLHAVPDLGARIWAQMQAMAAGPIGAVFTHDACGLYGHADHLAVYDAVRGVLQGTGIPLMSQAVPKYFHRWLGLRAEARDRVRPPITHKFDMPPDIQRRKAAATRAHRSQQHILFAMMQGRSPEHFYRTVPREFYTVEEALP